MKKKISDKMKRINLFNTGMSCIDYVGRANYQEREEEAKMALTESYTTGEYSDPEKIKRR